MHEISIAAEKLYEIFGLTVTNAVVGMLFASSVLIIFAFLVNKSLKYFPSTAQALVELLVDAMYTLTKNVTSKHAAEFFPLIMTIFLYILVANWSGLLPAISAVGFEHHVEVDGHEETVITPFFRAATTDLNTAIALALVSVFSINYYGMKHLGAKVHVKKFINFSSGPAFIFGLFEIVQELSRIISFAFRLFGNIFAGEVLIVVMTSLVPYIIPSLFIGLEIFVGIIQAIVFAMLTLVFASMAVEHHDSSDGHVVEEHALAH